MTEKQAKAKAKKELAKIKSVLKKAGDGKDTGRLGAQLFIDDAAELINYYKQVSLGKFKKAGVIQTYDMDTATYELINEEMFYFVSDNYNPEKGHL